MNNELYKPDAWAFKRKDIHRRWISDTIHKYQKNILVNGMLKKNLCFASLSGSELLEYQWYKDNSPFFKPEQYVAIDREAINTDKAKEYGIPISNIYSPIEIEHALRSIRTQKKIAIINADYLCTLKTCVNSISPMIRTLEICANKTGECFLFINAVTEFINSSDIKESNRLVTNYIEGQFIHDFFSEYDYVPVAPELLKYKGKRTSTEMFSFCLHLVK